MKHEFAVWAPKRKQVEVGVDGARHAMTKDEQGWWRATVEIAQPEVDYGFYLDGDRHLYPDPRSLWQPNGVHAASRTVDHARFAWTDAAFRPRPLASGVVYELHIGAFTPEGTFDAAIGKLDHLVQLGVTHVELMPVSAFEGERGWGYDGVALFAPQQSYGGPDGLKRLVDACHAKGLAVLLDVVYNHFGPSGNYTGMYAPYMTSRHHTPWGDAVNFEAAGSDQVRRFFIDNALMWMRDYHFDGLRLDAVHEFVDRSALHVLEQLAMETDDLGALLGKDLVLIAESDLNDPRLVTPREANGYGLAAQWSDDFHHALHAVLTGEQKGYYEDFGSMQALKHALEHAYVFDGAYSGHRERNHGRPVEHLSFHHFLGYVQNHDQVGNRAVGDRLCHNVPFARAQVGAALVLMSAFVPMLFMGEEWAASTPFQYFADHTDEALRKGVEKGRKREFAAFGWKPEDVPNPEALEAFTVSKLNWTEAKQGDHARMLEWYRQLVMLRRATPQLLHGEAGSVAVEVDEAAKTLQMRRGDWLVAANLGGEPWTLTVKEPYSLQLANYEGKQAGQTLLIPPNGVAILLRKG